MKARNSLLMIALFACGLVHAQVQEEWVARYSTGTHNYASGMVMDYKGNLYMTGGSDEVGGGRSYATVKFDPTGNQVWAARYQGDPHGMDYASGIAIDSAGNVYVTGQSLGNGTNYDYVTIKYDTDGNQLWVARYNGPANSVDYGIGIAVDVTGNVYVTGRSDDPGSISIATIKYDTDGNQLWVDRYNYAGGSDVGRAVAVDATGNVYVIGNSGGIGTLDYVTLKYDPDGNRLWAARYHGPDNGANYPNALQVDSAGNVYVTGQSWGGIPTFWDCATVKYDPDGNQLWAARYDGPGHSYDAGAALVVDSLGDVYVAGARTVDGPDHEYATIKYDSNGNELWVSGYRGPGNYSDFALAIALDSANNVYVTGQSTGVGSGFDYATLKYDPDGNQIWLARYNGPGNSLDSANSIILDRSGDVFVGGMSMGSSLYLDFAIVKYSQN